MKIYVGNLPYDTTDEQLHELFSEFGQILSTAVIMDRVSGRSRGFGFVEMANDAEAENAIEVLHQKDFNGRALTVNKAQPKENRPRPTGNGNFRERRNREFNPQ
ncbi:MAG: RNA-binding protein [Phycisphaerae bacterium]|jgi:RNA recognition motif-containing protein|nr:RNA-binding protein [Phycisphaerae bacterium]